VFNIDAILLFGNLVSQLLKVVFVIHGEVNRYETKNGRAILKLLNRPLKHW